MRDWWNKQQQDFDKRREVRFLANSSPCKIWEFLNIDNKIKKGTKVLNIGVGTGRDTMLLHCQRGVEVSVLDISPLALKRVHRMAKGYLSENLESVLPSDYFDLAISHLVSQHMGDRELLHQFRNVIRSIREKGIFALQFAWAEGVVVGGKRDQELGECSRYDTRMEYLIDKAGGKVVYSVPPIIYKDRDWGKKKGDVVWFGVHISKK